MECLKIGQIHKRIKDDSSDQYGKDKQFNLCWWENWEAIWEKK